MQRTLKLCLFVLVILITGCNTEQNNQTTQKNESRFPKGELLESKNFSGTVWLNMMGANDSTIQAAYGHVTFEPKARTNWHSHPGGQILFITEGRGYYQVQGQPARLLHKGDFIEIPPNAVHWHGAAPDSEFAHIAVSLNTDKGGAVWLLPVTDDEYNAQATE